MKIESRSVEIRLEQDAARSGPGVLSGVLITYGERASDRPERFRPGALTWPEGGVVLREQHNRKDTRTRAGGVLLQANLDRPGFNFHD